MHKSSRKRFRLVTKRSFKTVQIIFTSRTKALPSALRVQEILANLQLQTLRPVGHDKTTESARNNHGRYLQEPAVHEPHGKRRAQFCALHARFEVQRNQRE